MKVYELMKMLAFKPAGAEVVIDTGDGPWPVTKVDYEGDEVIVFYEDAAAHPVEVDAK